tara:strand:- start:932 stop:1312 length:381 start_codon:yes stop_codon:yes gene_type:complete
MINDTIDILDPFIINIGIDFVIRTAPNINKYDALAAALTALQNNYQDPFYIGESFIISDIYQVLKNTEGVLDVLSVKLVNKKGSSYSGNVLSINDNMSPEGNELVCPKNAVFEIKFPRVDIVGKVR